jgi:single-strand DNA-binding protein
VNNVITVIGNVTRDPELRFTGSGTGLCSFGIAVSRRWQNKQTQDWEEETTFLDVTVWQQMGENFAESISKGDRVFVTGRLDQDNWETDAGEKRSKLKITADDVGPSLRYATAQVVRNERSS